MGLFPLTIECLAHITEQPAGALLGGLEERVEILLYDLVEERSFGFVPDAARRNHGPSQRQWRANVVPQRTVGCGFLLLSCGVT